MTPVPFLERYFPPCSLWAPQLLSAYVHWFRFNAGYGEARQDGELVGVALARRWHQAGKPPGEYDHDPNGRHVYIDLVAVRHPRALLQLWQCLHQWLGADAGDILTLSFERQKHSAPVRTYSFSRFNQHIQKGK